MLILRVVTAGQSATDSVDECLSTVEANCPATWPFAAEPSTQTPRQTVPYPTLRFQNATISCDIICRALCGMNPPQYAGCGGVRAYPRDLSDAFWWCFSRLKSFRHAPDGWKKCLDLMPLEYVAS